jgi:hypothetical protein
MNVIYKLKRSKLSNLRSKLKNFRLEDSETIDNIYTSLMHIQNKFNELGEILSNEKVI